MLLIIRNDYAGSSSRFFSRTWIEYQQGFGDPTALYWIGLDRIQNVTQENCQVRFDLQDRNETWHYAQYSSLSVGDVSTNYTLTIGGYTGDTGYDGMAYFNGQPFSTYDADRKRPGCGSGCANYYGGGFWFCCCGVTVTASSPLRTLGFFGVVSVHCMLSKFICCASESHQTMTIAR